MSEIKLELLANRIEKTAILFELYKGLVDFFEKNPQDIVNVSFYTSRNSPKETRYINFKSSTDEGQSVIFSNVFHYLHKCVSLFDPIKSPFGLFSQSIVNKPQEVSLTFNKNNFCCIFDYADDFDVKKEFVELLTCSTPHIKYLAYYEKNTTWGKYPTMIINEKSYNDWQTIKSSEAYVENSYDYSIFVENANIIKKHYHNLKENQSMALKKSCLTIFEEGKILDCIELYDFDYIKGFFDKKDSEKGLSNFIKYNSVIFELNYSVTEKMLMEIFNE